MYDSTRFNEIFLTERDKQILFACAAGEILPLYPSEVQHLVELGFIYEYDLTGQNGLYAVTPQGQLYYEYCVALEKQKAEKMADEVAEKRQEHRFQVIHTLFTITATLFVEHFVEIVKFVYEFFQSLFTWPFFEMELRPR